ncbi:hypothetical protein N0V83_005493 [Neocucurbitaria cava]|uniref:Glycosyl transferase CAP10 domain-containing protein n=1 Tax=Neocucurbitaria cava TaxID=798079 RepID=A0A9W9CM30_9PLEO|nr:hypothetical protein N0V83_005493 [Neocucurbitaria cava]
MSYLLEFPPSALPHNVHSEPYVGIAIRGEAVDLPPRIPLAMVLYFAPKLKQWMLAPRSTATLPKPLVGYALCTPTIGIDITSEDIDEVGLGWIVTRMLTATGLVQQKELFPTHCSRVSAISIYKSWLALDLPVGGMQGLHLHLRTGLMTGSAVTLSTMKVIWETFPQDSPIVGAMGANFIRSHIEGEYTAAQSSMIQGWYQESVERREFFKSIQHQVPKLDEVQNLIDRAAVPADKGRAARIKAVLERVETRRMNAEEKKEREVRDTAGMRSHLRRVRSDESVRSVDTVIWDPPAQTEKPVLRKAQSTGSDEGQSTGLPLNLDEKECRAIVPSLFIDIDTSVAQGKFVFSRSDPDYKGLVQGRIKDGKLYILTAAPDTLPEILHQRTAILSQIHRALITSPSPLPNTHFAFCINDVPKNNTWAFSRPNKESKYNTWLMPSFASWSWPKANLGTMDGILDRIEQVENELEWNKKVDKVIWRGTPWFNPIGHPNLRKDLLKATKEKEWADVEALSTVGNVTNSIKIEDFCRYKYVVYAEGVTYSGRLPYHQACGSVFITAPLTWVTTSALLLRPIDAEELMSSVEGSAKSPRTRRDAKPTSTQQTILNPVATWQEANAIYVNPDFSNLEAVVLFLRSHPEVGQRLAQNQRETVVGPGYLSLAAETCYWRALVRAWSTVAEVDEQDWGREEGERYETWLLEEVSKKSEGTRGKIGG